MRKRHKVTAICRRLRKEHGPVEPPEQCLVLDELVAAILSQNTSDANSDAALQELRCRFVDWDAVRRASVPSISRAIRRAGLSNVKAPRLKAILQEIYRQRGEVSLEFLRAMPTPQAMDYLTQFPGIGPKTAACVLLFACRRPVLPVDTHVHRLSRRLGLIGPRTSAAKAHDELGRLVPPDLVLEFHVQLIRHGRTVCVARNPRCEQCCLLELCPAGWRLLQ